MESVQFQDEDNWPLLEHLFLRGSVAIGRSLGAFLNRHKQLKSLQIAAVSSLRPLGNSPGTMHQLLGHILSTELNIGLAESMMDYVTENASGHERSLFQHLYAQLDKRTDEKKTNDLRSTIVEFFDDLMTPELERHCIEIKDMRIQPEIANQLVVRCSIEVFWKDELAIKGMTWRDSDDGLWINENVMEILSISRRSKFVSLKGGTTM